MRISLLTAILMATILTSYGQNTYSISYNAAGNRVSKAIVIPAITTVTTTLKSGAVAEEESNATVASVNKETPFTETIDNTVIRIYPNPTRGSLVVKTSGVIEGQPSGFYLYDLNGKLVLQQSNLSESNDIDISNQTSGTYILKLTIGGKTSEWSIIKQ